MLALPIYGCSAMPSKIQAQISRDMYGSIHVHFVDAVMEPALLYKLCLERGLAVHGYSGLNEHWVSFNKNVDEDFLMMILHDRYDLSIRPQADLGN